MIKIGIPDNANLIPVANGKFTGSRIPLFESSAGEEPTPQAFLVQQVPDFNLSAHYHRQEQFQVVVRGSGTLGKHPIDRASVHYASREAGYGPIISGPQGLEYLTLRLVSERGAQYMPEERGGLRRGITKVHATAGHTPRVELESETSERRSTADESASSIDRVATLIEARPNGLGVWSTYAAEGETATPPGPIAGAGRMHVVIGGEFVLDGTRLPYASVVYSSNDESALRFVAEGGPAELLTLQFPDGADRDEYTASLQQTESSTAS